ncbi:MAG: ThiF family adenylyltransferase [Alloprevotella sp.]|nr:ThiF family adenylyltransferase [Alloprevotella sp.]
MFEYKDISFFNEYFSSLSDFKLSQEFVQEENGENKKLFIGIMESVNTVHPMSIKIEIPTTFPHSKLLFWTESLRGYPHLIADEKRKDLWFCLNTPFAETAEEQLEQEMLRLRDWIKRYVRKDLPTVIKDPEVYRALYMMNAYSWENIDEMNEYKQEARLTFVGDFATHKDYFKEKKGKFDCVKNGSERIFVLRNKLGTNFELPYIIVDKVPTSLNDFFGLKEEFGWDKETCEFLLPGLNTGKDWVLASSYTLGNKDYTEEEANKILDEIEQELHKDEPKLKAQCIPFGAELKLKDYKAESYKEYSVPGSHKSLLLGRISSLKESVKKEHGWTRAKSIFEMTNEDLGDEETIALAEKDQFELHHFALGIIVGEIITWGIISTNKASGSYDKVEYELTLCKVEMLHFLSKGCRCEIAQTITEKEYFGRGKFSSRWNERKVCVVGVGAIGSIVCESLARSGVSVIALWDDDTVEPGNICRSTFRAQDIGKSKVETIREHIVSINPFIELSTITTKGYWFSGINGNIYSGPFQYMHGSFYGSVNYSSQEDAIKLLDKYDLIIDCTGSNELLHFLSYAVPEKEIISMCITNRSRNLLLFSSNDGNPFELRKMYLSKIEQDTKNFYVEGSGCYSPTFIATYCDISTLVNLAIKELNTKISNNQLFHSVIWSYDNRGIIADRLKTYEIPNSRIRMTIPSETLMDGEEMFYSNNEVIGYLLGGYSADGTIVMVSHIIESENAKSHLDHAFMLSGGIIDYLGDYVYSDGDTGLYKPQNQDIMAAKAADENININNPVLATRNLDGTLSFYLYLAGKLEKFIPLD